MTQECLPSLIDRLCTFDVFARYLYWFVYFDIVESYTCTLIVFVLFIFFSRGLRKCHMRRGGDFNVRMPIRQRAASICGIP